MNGDDGDSDKDNDDGDDDDNNDDDDDDDNCDDGKVRLSDGEVINFEEKDELKAECLARDKMLLSRTCL